MKRFESRTAIVTGAASGIGAATARRLADEGARVVLVDRDTEGLESVAADLPEGAARTVAGDLTDMEVARRAVETATGDFGGLDILVANAGVAQTGTMGELSPEAFREHVHNNVDGTYNTFKASWDALKASNGAVIATSSVSGIAADWNAFAYNVTKAAVAQIVRGAALDYPQHGIRVNAVAPGFTKTGLTEPMMDQTEFIDAMYDRIPMGRAAEASEVASVVAFLASEDASFVNGAIVPVDGGLMASNGQPPLPG